MDLLEELRRLPEARVAVSHAPPTPRYTRARDLLPYLRREGRYLGRRPAEGRPEDRIEIAFWVPPPTGRGYGYYVCARLYFEVEEVYYAIVFCFYDGTEGSPGFKTIGAAASYASSQGFEHEN